MSTELRDYIKQEINRIKRQGYLKKLPHEESIKTVIPGEWIPQGTIRYLGNRNPLSNDDTWKD